MLAGAGAAAAVAGLLAGARRRSSPRRAGALTLGVLIVAVNAIASQRGDTILLRGGDVPVLGQIDVSAEALVEGAVLALRIAVVLCAFAVHSACVDPDRLLRLLRPVARHSALTATLITRLVPLAAADHARLREAQALRGPGAAPVGRAALTRRLVAGSLDRAVDVAATLELRGYARGVPRRAGRAARLTPRLALRRRRRRRSRRSGSAPALAGVGGFEAYPTIALDADPATLALAAALPLLAAAPVRRPRPQAPCAMAEPLVHMRGVLLRLSRRARAGAPRARARARRGRVRVLAGRSGSRQVDPAAGLLRARAALPRRRGRGTLEVCGLDVREHGPAELGGLVGLVGQEPETQVVSATVRGELELPLELRGEPEAGAGPRDRGGHPGARRSRTSSTARPTRSPAASCSGSRSPRRSSCGRG